MLAKSGYLPSCAIPFLGVSPSLAVAAFIVPQYRADIGSEHNPPGQALLRRILGIAILAGGRGALGHDIGRDG